MNENIDSLRREHNQRLVDLLVSTGQEPSDSYAMNYLLTSIQLNRRDTEAMCEVAMLRIVADELATARAENKQFRELLTGYFAAKSKGTIYSTAGDGMDNYMNKIAALLQEKEMGK